MLLQSYGINCVCDVRSVPYSRFAEQYNREYLNVVLEKHDIKYLFFGEEFGARRKEDRLLTDGIVDFEKVSKSEKFLRGVLRIRNGIEKGYKIVLMCTEKEPVDCHRTILVSRNLYNIGVKVKHILPDGTVKMHEKIEEELVDRYFPDINQRSLFNIDEQNDYISEAYRKANHEIGYRK